VKSSTFGEFPGLLARNIISTSSASLPDDDDDDGDGDGDRIVSQGSKNSLSSLTLCQSPLPSIFPVFLLHQNILNIGHIFEVPFWGRGFPAKSNKFL
jgi:hypothetical protein